jgi:hypothetical protein
MKLSAMSIELIDLSGFVEGRRLNAGCFKQKKIFSDAH